jgi:DNA-directed RNA polymerase specialized sigma24 family protein
MAGLRREEQELVRLCLFGELSVDVAATALGIPVGTAKSRLSRGRAKLRQALGHTPRRAPAEEPW